MASIFPFFQWCEQTWLFQTISEHESYFPALETVHLFGLILLLGTTVILSLRLLGVLMLRHPVSELARDLAAYQAWGLILMLVTGAFMFVATAVRNYSNTSFWVKMLLLAIALIFHFAVFRKIIKLDESRLPRGRARFAAWGALILWFGVGIAGRSIGFLG